MKDAQGLRFNRVFMTRFYSILLCFICILILAGCENFLGPASGKKKAFTIVQNPFYPLKVGNYWRYTTILYYPIPNIYDTISPSKSIYTVVRDSVIEYKDSLYQCVSFAQNSRLFQYSTASEIISFQTFDIPDSILRYTTLRFPTLLYDTLITVSGTLIASRTSPIIRRDTTYSICIGTNKEFETFVGKFRCYVIRSIYTGRPEQINHIYYAEGIGEVGRIIYNIDANKQEQLYLKNVLAEYRIN